MSTPTAAGPTAAPSTSTAEPTVDVPIPAEHAWRIGRIDDTMVDVGSIGGIDLTIDSATLDDDGLSIPYQGGDGIIGAGAFDVGTGSFSLMFIGRRDSSSNDGAVLIDTTDGETNGGIEWLIIKGVGDDHMYLHGIEGDYDNEAATTADTLPITAGVHTFAVTYDGTNALFYVDGVVLSKALTSHNYNSDNNIVKVGDNTIMVAAAMSKGIIWTRGEIAALSALLQP